MFPDCLRCIRGWSLTVSTIFFCMKINSYGLASMVLNVPSLAYCKHTCFNPVFYVFLLSSITYSYLSKEKS